MLPVSIPISGRDWKGVTHQGEASGLAGRLLSMKNGVYLALTLDIGGQGSRLSLLPCERLFPLYWLQYFDSGFYLYPGCFISQHLFYNLLNDLFLGTPVIPTSV